jgi:hypothetical protein
VRCASRLIIIPHDRYFYLGLRVARRSPQLPRSDE